MSEGCDVKCRWCGAECHRRADDPRGMFNPYHVWECGTWQRDQHFDRARVCEARCEERAKFHAELRQEIIYFILSAEAWKNDLMARTFNICASRLAELAKKYTPPEPEKGAAKDE